MSKQITPKTKSEYNSFSEYKKAIYPKDKFKSSDKIEDAFEYGQILATLTIKKMKRIIDSK